MNSTARLTGRLVAAARALTGISQSELAIGSGISLEMLRLLESSGAAWVPDDESQALGRALETFGVVAIPEGDGMGDFSRPPLDPSGEGQRLAKPTAATVMTTPAKGSGAPVPHGLGEKRANTPE
jgi:transcriptional regulator with XRE-family HTH domain